MSGAGLARVALVLAPPAKDRRIVTGLRLGERARRVAVRSGIAAGDVVVVRSADELRAARKRMEGRALLLLRATDQVVAPPLVEALRPDEPGLRHAIDPARGGEYAGAWVADAGDAGALMDALAADFANGDAPSSARGGLAIEVGHRARFPVPDREALRAAHRWQFELIDKPLDAPMTRYVYRPLARPLTLLFLRSPLSPNAISIISLLFSLAGCAIAGAADRWTHAAGLGVLMIGGIMDCCDGEVARLRLQSSKAGAWIDAVGDDLARIALILGLGSHMSYVRPDWPVWEITLAAVAMTMIGLALIYWYCIFVIHSSNNQDYTKVLGIGPGVKGEKRTIGQLVGDIGAEIVRRDVIDFGALVFAIVNVPEVVWIPLCAGSAVTLAVVIPTHLKIVRDRRAARAAAAA